MYNISPSSCDAQTRLGFQCLKGLKHMTDEELKQKEQELANKEADLQAKEEALKQREEALKEKGIMDVKNWFFTTGDYDVV